MNRDAADRDLDFGQRLVLGGVGSVALALVLAAVALFRFGDPGSNPYGIVSLGMLGAIGLLPYVQWVVALPFATALHVRGSPGRLDVHRVAVLIRR